MWSSMLGIPLSRMLAIPILSSAKYDYGMSYLLLTSRLGLSPEAQYTDFISGSLGVDAARVVP